ncbi:MAG: extracellular solute-binding protein [Epulopiscium sp.]|nr:extracellular solute-binding protein [Candidatus Epulonipiscium sp.]
MKIKKILISLLAMTLFILSFSGCKKEATKATTSETQPKGQDNTAQKTEPQADPNLEGNLYKTGLPILKEKEKFTIMIRKNSLSKNSYPEKIPVQEVESETNMEIIWQEIAPSGWTEKVNLSFASNDLPDAFISGINAATLMQNTKALIPIGDYVDDYAPNIKKLWEKRPDIRTALTTPDGKIYSFNTGEESAWGVTNSLLYINKTWLDDLGLEIPRTTEEYFNTLTAFKEKDVNKNGKPNDEIPFSFCQQDASYALNSFFGAFGILDNSHHLMVEDGKIIFPATRPEFREALTWFHSLVQAGLMDIEGFSQTLEQLQAKGKDPQILLGSFLSYNADTATGDNASHYIPIEPLQGPHNKTLWNKEGQKGGNLTGFIVTKSCKNPAAMVRWHDHINSSWENKMRWAFGPENEAWKFNENGLWIQNNDNLPEGASWGELRHTVAPASQANWFMTAEEGLHKRLLAPRTQDRLDAITNLYEKYFPKETLQINFEDPAIANEKNLLLVEIDAYLSNFIANSSLKGITDAQWEQHLKTCQSLNVDQYVQLWQDYYDTQK